MSYDELTKAVRDIRESGKRLARHDDSYERSEWEEDFKYDEIVDPKFEPYTRIPDPDSFDWMIEELGKAVEGLSGGDGIDDPLHGGYVLANPDLNKMAARPTCCKVGPVRRPWSSRRIFCTRFRRSRRTSS